MLNLTDSNILKKCLYPLIGSFVGSIFIYTVAVHFEDEWGLLLPILSLIVIGLFGYSLWNIWNLVDENKRVKIFSYIAIFSIILHSTTIVINHYFQGIIGLLYGSALLVFFWKFITKKNKHNK